MNRTLVALWAIIIGSIVSLVALVIVFNHQRQSEARLGLDALLRQQLEPYNRDVLQVFAQYQRELSSRLASFDPGQAGAITQLEQNSLIGLTVVVSDDGAKARLIQPNLEHARPEDRSLVVDAVAWLRDSNFTRASTFNSAPNSPAQPPPAAYPQPQLPQPPTPQPQPPVQQRLQLSASQLSSQQQSAQTQSVSSLYKSATPPVSGKPAGNSSNTTDDSHWTTWYHGRGMVLGYWQQTPGSTLTMVVVPRGRWLADVISALPDNSQPRDDALLQLVDIEGSVVTQWGRLDLADSQAWNVELPIADPLEGWRLRLHLSPQAAAGALRTDTRWLAWLGALAASATLMLLGVMVTLNVDRQLRQAAQQVSFVNQVSHELRTPLTNIRMYTDLALSSLESQSVDPADENLNRLTVVQQESSRLGRLIENVLSFARSGHAQRAMKVVAVADVDQLIDSIVETFRPQLTELEVNVSHQRGVDRPVRMDREVFEQILVNLISNALKYAAAGKSLQIISQLQEDILSVSVIDAGPGIPKRMRKRVFQPFVRLSNRLEDPTGTGIGLTIARQLARQHGGDCTLAGDQQRGCCFTFTIRSVS